MFHEINTASSIMTVSILNASCRWQNITLLYLKSLDVLEFEYKFKDRSIITINLIIEFKE